MMLLIVCGVPQSPQPHGAWGQPAAPGPHASPLPPKTSLQGLYMCIRGPVRPGRSPPPSSTLGISDAGGGTGTKDEKGTQGEALEAQVTGIQEGTSNSQASPGSSSLSLGYQLRAQPGPPHVCVLRDEGLR